MRPMFVITFLMMFLMLLWLLFRIWLEGKHQDTETPIGIRLRKRSPKHCGKRPCALWRG